MGFNYQEMMKQARAMQRQMEKIQEELKNAEFEASAGGGAVKVKVNGDQEILSLNIDKDAVDTDDITMLEDMVMVAVNDALKKSKDEARSRLSGLTGGMGIPGF
jgi:DNA-binding YbaB/EbfC family protein